MNEGPRKEIATKTILRNLFEAFTTKINEKRLEVYSDKLSQSNYSLENIREGADRAVEQLKFTPSYSELIELIRVSPSFQRFQEKKDGQNEAHFEQEEQRLCRLTEIFKERVSQEKDVLLNYAKSWLKNSQGVAREHLPNDLRTSMFIKPALFDWEDSGYGNDFDLIYHIARRKGDFLKSWKNIPENLGKTCYAIPSFVINKAKEEYRRSGAS